LVECERWEDDYTPPSHSLLSQAWMHGSKESWRRRNDKKRKFYAVSRSWPNIMEPNLRDALMEIYWQGFQNWSLEDFKGPVT